MPLQATSGAASYDAFGGGVPVVPNYIEDVFQTWLYSGNSSTQTITNGIDLSTKGGMVWTKSRNATYDNTVYDTARGTGNNKALYTNTTNAQGAFTGYQDLTAYNTDGYSIGSPILLNETGKNYVSWTFRKQPKFFDVVTYTGDGTSNRAVAHNLGSVPGFMIVKVTSESNNWTCWHRSITGKILELNTTAAQANDSGGGYFYSSPDATNIYLGSDWQVNKTDATYVAYLFAHNAGGFGLTGTDNVISCGSYTGNGSATGPSITLGYEPQWLLIKNASGAFNWMLLDNMRGLTVNGNNPRLWPNLSDAETTASGFTYASPTATGFNVQSTSSFVNANGSTYIYIAIRRGPMKVPTSGTSVFAPIARTGTSSSNTAVTAGFPVDAAFIKASSTVKPWDVEDRLRGGGKYLEFQSTAAEVAGSPAATINFTASNTGVLLGTDSYVNSSANSYANYFLQRAPSFFDEVCYTGTGAAQTLTHNLAAVPELMISRRRDAVAGWAVYSATLGATKYMRLQTDDAPSTGTTLWNDTAPTSTQFTLGSTQSASSGTYVQYLFATCAGVSKVGSYTGNGSSQTINCGFTGGSRFVLIKKTSGTGDWMISDSARGIVSGSDPYLELNNTNAEVTGEDWLDTDSTGFVVNEVSGSNANTNGATYIFLAIA
jgi:hypothetical protein